MTIALLHGSRYRIDQAGQRRDRQRILVRLPLVPHIAEQASLLDDTPRSTAAVEPACQRRYLLPQGHRQQQV